MLKIWNKLFTHLYSRERLHRGWTHGPLHFSPFCSVERALATEGWNLALQVQYCEWGKMLYACNYRTILKFRWSLTWTFFRAFVDVTLPCLPIIRTQNTGIATYKKSPKILFKGKRTGRKSWAMADQWNLDYETAKELANDTLSLIQVKPVKMIFPQGLDY